MLKKLLKSRKFYIVQVFLAVIFIFMLDINLVLSIILSYLSAAVYFLGVGYTELERKVKPSVNSTRFTFGFDQLLYKYLGEEKNLKMTKKEIGKAIARIPSANFSLTYLPADDVFVYVDSKSTNIILNNVIQEERSIRIVSDKLANTSSGEIDYTVDIAYGDLEDENFYCFLSVGFLFPEPNSMSKKPKKVLYIPLFKNNLTEALTKNDYTIFGFEEQKMPTVTTNYKSPSGAYFGVLT